MKKITIFAHGAAHGNPGPAAIGLQLLDDKGNVLHELVEMIGNASDAYAEYYAVMRSLQEAVTLFAAKTRSISFTVQLVGEETAQQLDDQVPITHPGLVPYFIEIHNLRVTHFPHVRFTHGPNGQPADRLVRAALDRL